MPLLRDKYFWFPLYMFLLVFLLVNFKKRGLQILLGLALTVGLADVVSSHFIKKMVMRERPCKTMQHPQEMNLLVRCGSGYSFPSSHAANHFALAVFLCFFIKEKKYRWAKYALVVWASAVCFAQIYVGVHYPADVLAGALLGTLLASSVYWFWGKWEKVGRPPIVPPAN